MNGCESGGNHPQKPSEKREQLKMRMPQSGENVFACLGHMLFGEDRNTVLSIHH